MYASAVSSAPGDVDGNSLFSSPIFNAANTEITVDAAHELLLSQLDPMILLDVRTSEKYANGHIDGAISLPSIDTGCGACVQHTLSRYKDAIIIVYSQDGSGNDYVLDSLHENGFTQVYNLMGGLTGWQNAGFSFSHPSSSKSSWYSSIDQNLQKNTPTFLFFYATWCEYCTLQTPIIEELQQERSGRIDFFFIDISENPEFSQDFKITHTPSMVLIYGKDNDGHYLSHEATGFVQKNDLESWLDNPEQPLPSTSTTEPSLGSYNENLISDDFSGTVQTMSTDHGAHLSGTRYARCSDIPSSVLNGKTCQEVTACGRLTGSNKYFLLVSNITTNKSCLWYEADNSVLDLNNYTVTYADVGFDGLYNNDFEIGDPEVTQPVGWDFSAAPHAKRMMDHYVYLSNDYLVNFSDVTSPETIVSDWVPITVLNRTYAGYGVMSDCDSYTIEVEFQDHSINCSTSTSTHCEFKPKVAGNYRLRITTSNDARCYVDLADIRPAYDAGIILPCGYVDHWRFPDYSFAPHVPNNVQVKNGRIIEAGHGSLFGKTVFNRGVSGGTNVHDLYTVSRGLDSSNYYSLWESNQQVHNNTFVNTNTYTTDRSALMGPAGFYGSGDTNNDFFNNTIIGGQGGVFYTGQNHCKIYNNEFYTKPAVTNHYGVTLYHVENATIHHNFFNQTGPGVFLSSKTRNTTMYDNLFYLTAMSCDSEYPTQYTTSMLRISDYDIIGSSTKNNHIYNNVIFGVASYNPRFPRCLIG